MTKPKQTQNIWLMNDSQILTPTKWEILHKNLNPYYQIFGEALLFSGLRPTELRRYADNSHWRQSNKIVLPEIKNKQIPRVIPLSNEGRYAMEVFDLTMNTSGVRARENVHQALVRAVKRVNGDFAPIGINESMFRETWIAWLVACYPEKWDEIRSHMSCEPEEYKEITFDKKELASARKYTEGW
jgi:hypothetical protein